MNTFCKINKSTVSRINSSCMRVEFIFSDCSMRYVKKVSTKCWRNELVKRWSEVQQYSDLLWPSFFLTLYFILWPIRNFLFHIKQNNIFQSTLDPQKIMRWRSKADCTHCLSCKDDLSLIMGGKRAPWQRLLLETGTWFVWSLGSCLIHQIILAPFFSFAGQRWERRGQEQVLHVVQHVLHLSSGGTVSLPG